MSDLSAITGAIDALAKDGYAIGPAWEAAHELAMAREGEAIFDRLHALLHRIEGDPGNAAYWYRRAGVTPFAGPFEEEAADLGNAAARRAGPAS